MIGRGRHGVRGRRRRRAPSPTTRLLVRAEPPGARWTGPRLGCVKRARCAVRRSRSALRACWCSHPSWALAGASALARHPRRDRHDRLRRGGRALRSLGYRPTRTPLRCCWSVIAAQPRLRAASPRPLRRRRCSCSPSFAQRRWPRRARLRSAFGGSLALRRNLFAVAVAGSTRPRPDCDPRVVGRRGSALILADVALIALDPSTLAPVRSSGRWFRRRLSPSVGRERWGPVARPRARDPGARPSRRRSAPRGRRPHCWLAVARPCGPRSSRCRRSAASVRGGHALEPHARRGPILAFAGLPRPYEVSHMRRATDRAEEVLGGRAEIASMVAHEIRGPVGTIRGPRDRRPPLGPAPRGRASRVLPDDRAGVPAALAHRRSDVNGAQG